MIESIRRLSFLGHIQSKAALPPPALPPSGLHGQEHLHPYGVLQHGEATHAQVRTEVPATKILWVSVLPDPVGSGCFPIQVPLVKS